MDMKKITNIKSEIKDYLKANNKNMYSEEIELFNDILVFFDGYEKLFDDC